MDDVFREVPVEGSGIFEPTPETIDVTYAANRRIKSAVGYLYNKAKLDFTKDDRPKQSFKLQDVPERHADRSDDYLFATTQEEADLISQTLDQEKIDDKIFANATFSQNLFGGAVTPEAVVPMFRVLKGGTILATTANTAATAGVTTGGIELLRSAMPGFDPIEGMVNTGGAVLFSGMFAASLSGVSKSGALLLSNARNKLGEHAQTITEMRHFEKNYELLLAEPPASRPYADSTDIDIRTGIQYVNEEIMGLNANLQRIKSGDPELEGVSEESILKMIFDFESDKKAYLDELTLRRLDKGVVDQMEIDPWNVVSSMADPLDKLMPTPLKTVLREPITKKTPKKLAQALNNFKRTTLEIANDSALLLNGHLVGMTIKPSLYQRSSARVADVIGYERQQAKLWKEATDAGLGSNILRKMSKADDSFEAWLRNVNIKRITGAAMTPQETKSAELMTKVFGDFAEEAETVGVLGSRDFVSSRLAIKEMRLEVARGKLQNAISKNYADSTEYYTAKVQRLEEEVDELQASLEFITNSKFKPTGNGEPYYTREFLADKISEDEKGQKMFRKIITEYVRENPFGVEYDNKSGLWKPKDMTGDLEAQDRFVNSYIQSITSEPGQKSSSAFRSQRMPSRVLNIPNAKVLDFINTDVTDVMRRYMLRNSQKVEFSKMFGNRTYEDLMDELVDDLIDNGMSLKKANQLRKETTSLFERVTNDVVSDPTTFTNKTVQFLKEFTSVNYLQSSGVTTIGDVPKIIMENGFKNIARGAASAIDSVEYRKQFGQIQSIIGEAAELSLGTTQLDTIENSNVRALGNKWDTIKSTSFVLNGLGPMTVGMKTFTGTLSIHEFAEIAMNVSKGIASKYQLNKALRYGLPISALDEIAAKAPLTKTKAGLFIGNLEQWAEAGVSADTIARFRSAVASNIQNTILSSTPATRFKYADGKIFFPIKAARKIFPDIEEDKKFPGYAVMESGVMTLPFVFYNWPMSAAINIIQSTAQGQVKNAFGGFATMLGFGYLLAKVRTPEWAWEEMDYDQRFMAAVERSGISAIYGDIAMTGLRAAVQLDLNNPDNDFVRLGFYGKPGYAEAAATVLGAPASQIKDFLDIGGNISRGEYSEALTNFYYTLPFTQSMWWKDHSEQMIKDLSRSLD